MTYYSVILRMNKSTFVPNNFFTVEEAEMFYNKVLMIMELRDIIRIEPFDGTSVECIVRGQDIIDVSLVKRQGALEGGPVGQEVCA